MSDLAANLDRFLADQPIHARPASTARRVARWVIRQRWMAGGIAMLLLAV